jgi:protein-tyrosine phosphatase
VSNREYVAPPGVQVLRLPIPDVSWFDIRTIFAATNSFIADSLQNGHNVLVHCAWGISRSATVVVAFLMAFYRLTPHLAIEFLKSKRSCINPNPGFRKFLHLYQLQLEHYRKSKLFFTTT